MYIKPELKITEISAEDIIRTSTVVVEEAPKTTIEGVEITMQSYGTHNFSIFE